MNKLLSVMKEKGISQAHLAVIDVSGQVKYMIVPRQFLEEGEDGIGIDGSSIPGFTTVADSDLIARPDFDSAVFIKDGVTIFCDVEYEDGRPCEGDSRRILKTILEKGDFLAKPELEFFLLRDGTPLDDEGYMDEGEGLAIIQTICQSVNVEIERIHHENGPGQYEIEPVIAPALKACDTVVLLKQELKRKAQENGITATFMPKPLPGEAGSGMHFHVLLERNGEDLFENFADTTVYFIGGLLSHARGITAICNPTINSYKRLVPNYEAPVKISWGRGNRSVLVRIPRGGRARIEYRAPDPSCNPYLALAVILGAGLDGIQNKIEPPEEIRENAFEQDIETDVLPATLGEALKELERDDVIRKILGEHLTRTVIVSKRAEIREYATHVSQWELDHYLKV
jgi:glutamine synthetase